MKNIYTAYLFLLLILAGGCGKLNLKSENTDDLFAEINSVGGEIKPLLNQISDTSELSIFPLAYASCSDVDAYLYEINEQGMQSSSPLASAKVSADARYLLGQNLNPEKTYLVEVIGCSQYHSRIVSKLNRAQDIHHGTTALSFAIDAGLSFSKLDKAILDKIQSELSGPSPASVINKLSGNGTLSNQLNQAFKDPQVLAKILQAPPKILPGSFMKIIAEGATEAYTISTYHFASGFQAGVEWGLDNSPIPAFNNLTTFSFAPGKDSQGVRQISYKLGTALGGVLDSSKPYVSGHFYVNVLDTFPVTAPDINVAGSVAYTANTQVPLEIFTGNALANCSTFTSLAIKVNDSTTPAITDFIYACTDPVTQTETINLGAADGTKQISIWAIDSQGTISSPKQVSIIKDTVPPTFATALSITGPLVSGQELSILLNASDLSQLAGYEIEYSINGGTSYLSAGTALGSATSYALTVPATTTNNFKIRVTAEDQLGSTTSIESGDIVILAEPVNIASASLPAFVNTEDVNVSITGCAGINKILLNESSAPTASTSGWINCTATVAMTLSSAEGLKNVKVWAKDIYNNVSLTPVTATTNLDMTPPSLAFTSAATIYGRTADTKTITWTGSDLNLSATPVTIDFSVDAGVTWNTIAPNEANDGTYSLAIPTGEGAAKIKVILTDKAGNKSSVTGNVIIDNTAPTITSFTKSAPDTVASPIVSLNLVATDALTSVSKMRFLDCDSDDVYPGDCQNSGWIAFNTATALQLKSSLGLHTIYAQVSDSLDNQSAPSTLTISLDAGSPPFISLISPAEGSVLTGSSVLDFHIHDNESDIQPGSINIFYSINGGTVWTTLVTGESNDTSSSNVEDVTYSYALSASEAAAMSGKITLFKVRAQDSSGNVTSYISKTYNGNISIIAGGIRPDTNVSAKFSVTNFDGYRNASAFVRNPITGEIFFLDNVFGIERIDPVTGIRRPVPLPGGETNFDIDRDNFGNVYGCDYTGIYKWNLISLQWDFLHALPCSAIGVVRNSTTLKFYYHGRPTPTTTDNKLHYFDGVSSTHVAYNGSVATDRSDFKFHPALATTSSTPSMALRKNIVVSNSGLACQCDNGGNSQPSIANWSSGWTAVCYDPSTQSLHYKGKEGVVRPNPAAADVWGCPSGGFFRTSDGAAVFSFTSGLDEDPFTGETYHFIGNVIKRYGSAQLLADSTYNTTSSQSKSGIPLNENHFIETTAFVTRPSGDNGHPLDAHIFAGGNLRHIPFGPQKGGVIISETWGGSYIDHWRYLSPARDKITRFHDLFDYTVFGEMRTLAGTAFSTGLSPHPLGGFAVITGNNTFMQYVPPGNGTIRKIARAANSCETSPVDGQLPGSTTWPQFSSYWPLWAQMLIMTDQYIYVSGYRAKPGKCTSGAEVGSDANQAGAMIKRFAFNPATGVAGVVQHVAGTDVDYPATNPSASNANPTTIAFRGKIHAMKENLNTGVGKQLFFIQGSSTEKKLRRITFDNEAVSAAHVVTGTVLNDVITSQIFVNLWDYALFNVNKNATAGVVFWTASNSKVYATNLGSNTTTQVNHPGLDAISIRSIDHDVSTNSLIYADASENSTIYQDPISITETSAPLVTSALAAATVNPGEYTVSWTSPSPISNTKGYRVAYKLGFLPPADCVQDFEGVKDVVLNTSATFDGLLPSSTYSFRICTYNNIGVSNAGVTVSN